MRTKLLTLTLMLSSLATPSYAKNWLDKQMFSLAPYVQLYGPVQGTMLTDQYKTKVLRIILEEGHEKAREYLQVGDYDAYWAFMIAALTVPLHEGSNLHLRKKKNESGLCQERSNSGSIFSGSSKYTATFKRIFKKSPNPAVPECSELKDDPLVHQMLHGADGSDMGIMQVNLYWHERNYLATGDWASVRKSIRYGLSLLKTGFDGVYRNSNRYSCVQMKDGVNYTNLIRAAWSGNYNSGNLASSCRFADPNSDWAQNDRNFKASLDKILTLDSKAMRQRFYELEDREDTLLGEIITHFKEKTADATILTDYLLLTSVEGTDKVQPLLDGSGRVVDIDPIPTHPIEPPPVVTIPRREISPARLYAVKASVLNFRDGPSTKANDCGDLPKNTEVIVQAEQGNWYELLNDEMLASYQSSANKCKPGARFASKDYLIDKGPLFDAEDTQDSGGIAVVELDPIIVTAPRLPPTPVATPAVEQRNVAHVNAWVTVREDRPHGYTMAAPTGKTVGPAGVEIIIAQTVWNSSNSEYPWYRITSPQKGWIYGKYVDGADAR